MLSKIASGLYALTVLGHQLHCYILNQLYHALIHPHLTYGCILWGKTFKKFTHTLEVRQKKAVRIISRARYNESVNPLFKSKSILKFEDIYKLMVCQFMHRLYTQEIPRPLWTVVRQNLDIHDVNTRNKRNFVTIPYKNTVLFNSLIIQGPKIWNPLPRIKDLSYKQFGKKYKIILIKQYANK